MHQPSLSTGQESDPYSQYANNFLEAASDSLVGDRGLIRRNEITNEHWLVRRWRRERRRRKVGRAYDMALEIARVLPIAATGMRVLDVGCGNGYIAHHLSAILGTRVAGIDLAPATEAPIEYRQFDGTRFPFAKQSLDAVLLCYVLHHAQDLGALMNELRRVLRGNGQVVVYEDMPLNWCDRFVCGLHNRQWLSRTGPCTFQMEESWQRLFESAGFEIITSKPLSRWRNLAHPVSRRLFLLRLSESIASECQQ